MITVKGSGAEKLLRQIKVLELPPSRQRQLNRRLGREVIRVSRQRIRQQRQIDGSAFTGRRNGRKKKMLSKLMKSNQVKVWAGSKGAKVSWKNSLTGKIARAHQEGFKEPYSASRIKREERKLGEPSPDGTATAAQAKALVDLGYKRVVGKYKSGKKKGESRKKRVSQKWIRENMSAGQAGIIIRLLREDAPKQFWNVEVPAREFFGLSKKEIQELGNEIVDDILEQVKQAS